METIFIGYLIIGMLVYGYFDDIHTIKGFFACILAWPFVLWVEISHYQSQ